MHSVRIVLFVLAGIAFFAFWSWGLLSFLRGKRQEEEETILGGRMRTVRSGPFWRSTWEPETGPGFLGTAIVYLTILIGGWLLDANGTFALGGAIVLTGYCIYKMRQTIGLTNPYAKAALAVFTVTIIVAAVGSLL